jgi:hypothetical protein
MVRRVGGFTRPAVNTLAQFWALFDPEESTKEIFLRYRSAPWDDILSEGSTPEDQQSQEYSDNSSDYEQEIQDSPTVNRLPGRPTPQSYKSVAVNLTPAPQKTLDYSHT